MDCVRYLYGRYEDNAMKTPAFIESLTKRLHPPEAITQHDPSRDWLVMLVLSLLVLAASMLWNAWFLVTVLSDEAAIEVPQEMGSDTTSTFEKMQHAFMLRDAVASSTHATRFNDPSK